MQSEDNQPTMNEESFLTVSDQEYELRALVSKGIESMNAGSGEPNDAAFQQIRTSLGL